MVLIPIYSEVDFGCGGAAVPPPASPIFVASEGALTCNPNDPVVLTASGGVPPYTWTILTGDLILNTNIGSIIEVTRVAGNVSGVSYFIPYMGYFNVVCNPGIAICEAQYPTGKYATDFVASCFLLGYNCNGVKIVGNKVFSSLNVETPSGVTGRYPLGPLDDTYEFAEMSMSEVCDFTTGSSCNGTYGLTGSGPNNTKNKNFQVSACMCCDNQLANAVVRIYTNLAGRNAYNGIVWSGAEIYDEVKQMVIPPAAPGPVCGVEDINGVNSIDFPALIDVRTQDMVDDGCCVEGPAIVVVTDSVGSFLAVELF